MEESFKPTSVSVSQLFGDPKILYRVPQYQRPYKWINEQVEQLWEDIFDAYKNNIDNYFLGSVITARTSNGNGGYVDLVDGQQRLTTLMILFCVLRDNYENINAKDTDPFTIDIDAIKSAISLNNKSNRLKLFTHLNHQSDFSKMILEEKATFKIEPVFKYQLKKDQEPKYKFRNTAIIFKEKLASLETREREEFVKYLFNRVQLIRIDCSNRDFAIKLFQILNNRGMDLTAEDLIKSYLISVLNSKYKDDEDLLKNYEERFISDWHNMEEIMKRPDIDINLGELFTMYQYYLLANNPKKSLTEELQELFKGRDPNEVIADLKAFVNLYITKIVETKSKVIYSLKYIRWGMYWKTIAMTTFIEKYKYTEELLWELRKFYYLYWIAGKTLTQIKQTSFNVVKAVKEGKHINYIKKIFENKIEKDKIIVLVKENIKSKEIDEEVWIKPLLLLMEYEMTDNSVSNFIKMDQDVQLEHILPKKYEREEWSYINSDIAGRWLRSAANLTLLSGKKNMEASNNNFPIKMKTYFVGKEENTTSFSTTHIR